MTDFSEYQLVPDFEKMEDERERKERTEQERNYIINRWKNLGFCV